MARGLLSPIELTVICFYIVHLCHWHRRLFSSPFDTSETVSSVALNTLLPSCTLRNVALHSGLKYSQRWKTVGSFWDQLIWLWQYSLIIKNKMLIDFSFNVADSHHKNYQQLNHWHFNVKYFLLFFALICFLFIFGKCILIFLFIWFDLFFCFFCHVCVHWGVNIVVWKKSIVALTKSC